MTSYPFHAAVHDYDSTVQHTDSKQRVRTEDGLQYAPKVECLPIGPEEFDPSKWNAIHKSHGSPLNAGHHLGAAAQLYQERNAVYGDNYKRVGPVMANLFPDGVNLKTDDDFMRFHLLELIVVKLTRYCHNYDAGGHEDSITDLGVYAFMLKEADQLAGGQGDLFSDDERSP